MKIPNADAAFVAEEKIRDYLLNAAHPDNGGKAAFFMALGFGAEDWPAGAASLREIAGNTEVAETFESIHGRKYTLIGRLQSPSGRLPVVQPIWIIDPRRRGPAIGDSVPIRGVSHDQRTRTVSLKSASARQRSYVGSGASTAGGRP